MKENGRIKLMLPTLVAAVGVLGIAITVPQTAKPTLPDIQVEPPKTLGSPDNTSYAKAFPDEYTSWKRTEEAKENTKYAGSGFRDYLADHPELCVLWAGYPFAIEYNAPRGHYHALEDLYKTGRRNEKTPATCYSCKSPNVPTAMARDTVRTFYGNKFDHYIGEMKNPIGCADCHELKTMKLQISRPGLIEGYKAMGKDITKATKEEMRSLVCAQCHVEYHFKGQGKYLKFPWDFGLKAEDFDKYYDTIGFSDWTHAISGAKMVKMQHPDFEVFQQSLHGKRGVSCADCHMPSETKGGKDVTDHQIQSPLYNVDKTCANCHNWTPDQARERVYEIQDRNREMLNRAQRVLTSAHLEIGDAMKLGATDEELLPVRKLVSKAQMYWDYIAASNGMGFHAPQESARVLGKALDIAQECRLKTQALRMKHGATGDVEQPDISSKAKAQAYIKPFVEAAAKAAAAAAPGKPPRG
ncbi:MAG: ammonia-forming cytochrome c nitrite reductase subunit c552 [Armatimonadetes bacterium]|nr:ammonia-forming cytochrome c nitrite reductase subunit c552 [Armatimonadota bacterium]